MLMLDFLNEHWWLAILLVDLAMIFDFVLTVIGNRAYQKHASSFVTYQNGYELNPKQEKEIASNRWLNPKLVKNIIILSLYLALIGFFGGKLPLVGWFFEFMVGGILLSRITIILNHLSNLLFFADTRKEGAVEGHLRYSYWIGQRRAAWSHFSNTTLFLIMAALSARAFFWGGAAVCLMIGLFCLKWSKREFYTNSPEK